LNEITSTLSNKPPHIILWHLSTDPEATNLYSLSKDTFVAAGVLFGPNDDRQLINSGLIRYGILLSGRKSELVLMQRALEIAGLQVTAADIRDDTLNVWIGVKPRSH
jgi:hypothetical protein